MHKTHTNAQNAQNAHGVGNTNSTPKRKRRWCFTVNNYTDDDIAQMHKGFDNVSRFIVGTEIGTSGTPHLQGYVEFKNPHTFESVQSILPRSHIEPARGNRKQNITYCSKERVLVSTFPMDIRLRLLKNYDDTVWKPWQLQILDIVNSEPDARTFHWFWESAGNVGKSFLSKYIYLIKRTIIADGKKDNVFNQILTDIQSHDDDPNIEVILLDIPRHNLEYVNYGMLEQIKNGLVYSGKYEGGVCLFDKVHLIIFANEYPKEYSVSTDRWNIVEIGTCG